LKASTHGWALVNSYLKLPEQFYSRQEPTPVKSPKLIICNKQAAAELGLEFNYLTSAEGVAILSGNIKPPNAAPIAQAYAGHQFGYFTMLGDGRALLLGEQLKPSGERVDIQLKGSGRTPYSRGGDGRAALGPMLREYIISEAMHALNIPTTRSLAVVATGEPVYRETTLKGAVLTRLAKSHIRVGTFEFAAYMLSVNELKKLADYTISRHFPDLLTDNRPYLALLREAVNRQALLISKWQLAGFIHGVMNTDNMSICGETIDYGPCAFMDEYDPKTVFSSIDTYGRYAYNNQPKIAQWNLARFAETLLPLIDNDAKTAKGYAQAELSRFNGIFNEYWLSGMRLKLGLANEEAGDKALVELLLELMQKYRADYTNTFLSLTFGTIAEINKMADFEEWYMQWHSRLRRQNTTEASCRELMKQNNPALIPRNHIVEEALIKAEAGDISYMKGFLKALRTPYAHLEMQEEYTLPAPKTDMAYKTFCGT